jgi:tellurite resistance protein TerC
MDSNTLVWTAFGAVVLVMLALDLFVFGRRPHEVTMREAGAWSAVWLSLGLAFTGVVWATAGGERAGEYLAGYLIEKSLSVDNIFVFALIFGYFAVPLAYRPRVLMWGILGALVMRAVLIFVGAVLLDRFHVVVYVFGALLVITGIRMARHRNTHVDPGRNPLVRLVGRAVPTHDEYDGHRLFTRVRGRRMATPLVTVFVAVATTDLVFAIDSIPAIYAVTESPFIVLTANVFALLGLRALYFLLDGMMHRFVHLQAALAAILVFVGTKMLLVDVYKVPVWASLLVIVSLVAVGIVASLRSTRRAPVTAIGGSEGAGRRFRQDPHGRSQ